MNPNIPIVEAPRLSAEVEPFAQRDFDAEDLIERLMGDRALAKLIATTFVDSMPLELLALSEAIRNADAPAVVHTAHSIKGAAANAGGIQVQALASQLESLGKTGSLTAAPKIAAELEAKVKSLESEVSRFCDEATALR